jgi:hypothetical protein
MKRFPVLNANMSIPWHYAETFRNQAELNHDQTLEELADRGGLSWAEIACAVTKQPLGQVPNALIDNVITALQVTIDHYDVLINTPETESFENGIRLEAAHQTERWGEDHDAAKTAFDWFWLIGYLSQKAASALQQGDIEKARHHMITTAAALKNWYEKTGGL